MVHVTDNILRLNDNISVDYENKQQLEVTLRAEDQEDYMNNSLR